MSHLRLGVESVITSSPDWQTCFAQSHAVDNPEKARWFTQLVLSL